MTTQSIEDSELLKSDAFVNGAWTASEDSKRFAVTNPATGEELALVSDLAGGQTEYAITAADAAWPKPWYPIC